MNLILQTLVSALVQGSMLALITIGMSLVYGTLRVLNMAQGVMVMVGGVAAWALVNGTGVSPWIAMIFAVIVTFILGMLSYGVGISRLVGRAGVDFEMTAFISTFAIASIVQSIVQLSFGPRQKDFPTLLPGRIELTAGVSITWHQILTAAIAIVALVALGLFLSRSRYGLAIVAVAQNLDAARLMGIPARRAYVLTMGLAAGLAGLAGVLLAPVYFVSPTMGELPMLQALIVAIFAGLGSTRGTIIAAYIIGFVQAAVSIFWSATYAMPVLYALIVVVLIVRPFGIAGKPQEARL
ncbi:branched-chain amino acid ABC transporter permease [Leucobacter luti]|uniref:Amino acid/amide ABC transporter membrane protein 1 (HAAT family) n=1 Tax=Leucobacter luti TaxID=340320 RepID=A0A4Q7U596_9MICO|nr:branched-chain amino acid ABC transporter permease [Leucobacter luti]MBL3700561.1 branched-chain amino acid ABC transporter permease [Leucobacter luti]RZT68603.1 amino acid/amide ABC transporter membrane protein 1 (HAAT family) [Leucobacter luti]